MLVFLAGTARTRFVATDLLAGPCERLWFFEHRYVSFFLGLEIRFGYAGTAVAEDRMFVVDVRGRFRLLHLLELFGTADMHHHERLRHVGLDGVEHQREQLERFALVLLRRILLRVAAQVDALTQVIERCEVLAPVGIEACSMSVRSYPRMASGSPSILS